MTNEAEARNESNLPFSCTLARSVKRILLAVATVAILGAFGSAPDAMATTDLAEQVKLIASDADAYQIFGSSVDIDGDTMVVISPQQGAGGVDGPGCCAYVYRRSGGIWVQEAILENHYDTAPIKTVAVSGDTIVVGVPDTVLSSLTSVPEGLVLIYERSGTTWNLVEEIGGDLSISNRGHSVDISSNGNVIVVGSPRLELLGKASRFSIYTRGWPGWNHETTIEQVNAYQFYQFGATVRIARERIAVANPTDDNAHGTASGAIYVFDRVNGEWVENAKLMRAGEPGESLGLALAMNHDGNLIVASETDSGNGASVYVFEKSGANWVQQAQLTAPDPGVGGFGADLVVTDNTILVGYSGLNDEQGGAYLFRRSGSSWAPVYRLAASDAVAGDRAGSAVAMDNGLIALGAPGHDAIGEDSGSVYLFQDPDWFPASTDLLEGQKLVASDAAAYNHFGYSVDISGDAMVATSTTFKAFTGGEDNGNGSAYVYRLIAGTWQEEAILTPSDGFVGQKFGFGARGMAISGDTIIVGAMYDGSAGPYTGAAYVFERIDGHWDETAKLTASDAVSGFHLGVSVDISSDANVIVVGGHNPGNIGAAYVYTRSGSAWVEQAKLVQSDGEANDLFGESVKIAGGTIAVGALGDNNETGIGAGAVYVFGLEAGNWVEQAKLTSTGGQPGEHIGEGVAISPDGNLIATPELWDDYGGGVYVFERTGTGWIQQAKLLEPPDPAGWSMGEDIAMTNDRIVVGSSAIRGERGGAYVYLRTGDTWRLSHRLLAGDGAPYDWAFSVAIGDGHLAVGAPWHDSAGDDSGAVYVYRDPDLDADGMNNEFESGFGGTDPENSIVVSNIETGDTVVASGSAEEGATLTSGSFELSFPPNTSVDAEADQIVITFVPGSTSLVAISGANLAGGTKSITMPFDGDAEYPAVCIDDSPTATIELILVDGACTTTQVAIPAAVGDSVTVGPHTVTHLAGDQVRISGLSHTVMATLAATNAPPDVTSVTANTEPVGLGAVVAANATFTDIDALDVHIAEWAWGDGTTSAGTVDPSNRSVSGSHTYSEPGVYTVSVTVTDQSGSGLSDSASYQYVVIYDPDGGFVTGGGWINSPAGAYIADPGLIGKANFGFVAKYKKGKTVPEGNTDFHFRTGDLTFKSTGDYMWLVVSGSGHKATYKGTGTINGGGNYGFMVTAIDAQNTASTDVDLFRIKIWDKDDGDAVVYDNQLGTDCASGDDADPCTAIGGGNIKIHK